MFVKVVHHKDRRESVYECRRYFVRTTEEPQTSDETQLVFLSIEDDLQGGVGIEMELDVQDGIEIYAMNDQGRTIERYAW